MNKLEKPLVRSTFRIQLGKCFYTFGRLIKWYFYPNYFAKTFANQHLAYQVFSHHSILLRQLNKVDMQLQYNKIDNLKIALKKINQLVIKPGETFSFWYLVGNTTQAKGYKKGMILQNGDVMSGYGGGLCQLSNLLYWMVLHTPLTVVERHRHSYDVFPDVNRSIPFGCGATISYNYIDFQFKNETKQSFQLLLWLSEKDLHGEICSDMPFQYKYEVIESNHLIKPEYWGAYSRHNQIIRRTYLKKTNQLINEEIVAENHALLKYNPMLEASNASS